MHDLVHLCHHKWSIPAIGAIASTHGGRYAALRHRLDIAKETTRRAVRWLEEQDYVIQNPGYGHPLRPELLLTPWGEAIAGPCRALLNQFEASSAIRLALGRKWSLPALVAISLGDGRYSQLEWLLEGCSPRALTQTLRALEDGGLIEHHVIQIRPMRAEYRLSEPGSRIAQYGVELSKALGSL